MTRIKSNTTLLPRSASSPLIYTHADLNTAATNAENDTVAKDTDRRECILFPTYAYRDPKDPTNWTINIRGWALTHNCSPAKQKMVMSITRSVAGKSSVDSKSSLMFEQRFKYFLATNKRHKPFLIKPIGIRTASTAPSSNETTKVNPQLSSFLQASTKAATGMDLDEGHLQPHFHHEFMSDNHAYCYAYTPPASPSSSSEEGEDTDNESYSTTFSTAAIYNSFSFVTPRHDRPTNPISTVLDRNSSDQTSNLLLPEKQSPLLHQHQRITGINTTNSFTTPLYTADFEGPMTPKLRTKFPFIPGTTRAGTNLEQHGSNERQRDGSLLLGTRLKTQASGFLSGRITISHETILQWAQFNQQCDTRLIHLQSVCDDNVPSVSQSTARKARKSNKFFPTNHGTVNLIEPLGISIISDIDDTIKITEILSGARTVLSKTFFETPLDVPGMSDVYMAWYSQGAAFHYVSNSPFQLMPMLENFLRDSQFPPGSVHLRDDGKLIARLVETPGQAKHDAIEKIMSDFPLRHFILIGDSGEIDLEVYTRIALERPEQVLRIYIRDVTTPSAVKKKKEKKGPVSLQRQQQFLLHDSLQQQQEGHRKSSGSITSLFLQQKRRFSSQSTPAPQNRTGALSIEDADANNSVNNCDNPNSSTISSNSSSSPVPSSTAANRKSKMFGSPLKLRKAVVKTITEYAIEPHLTGHRGAGRSAAHRMNSNDTLSTVSSNGLGAEEVISVEKEQNTNTADVKRLEKNEACRQLLLRVEKARNKLATFGIDIILFEDAQVLQKDTIVQTALWSHWDSQADD